MYLTCLHGLLILELVYPVLLFELLDSFLPFLWSHLAWLVSDCLIEVLDAEIPVAFLF